MNVSIIIPNYNGENLLRKNLPGAIEAVQYYQIKTNSNVEIIIVDDGSTDSSIEEIKDQRSKIKNTDQRSKITIGILQNNKNLGFSSTVNKGVKEAEGEIVVLLNTDVAPEKNFLLPLLKHFEDPKVFAVGCMDKSVEGTKIVLRGRGLGRWEKGFFVHRRGEVDRTDTLWVSGGSGAFRKNIWEKLGGLSELYNPFYWEDIDISYRALKSGYKVLFEPQSCVLHEHSIGAINRKYSPFQIKTIAYRNQFIFIWKNITDFNLIMSHIIYLPYYIIKSLFKIDSAFILGFFRALLKLPQILSSRRKAGQLLVKKDCEFLKC